MRRPAEVKSRLARKAQPVPPLYQPEVAADAIVWAARHAHREVWVGAPVVKAILADRTMPGRAARWLAQKGYEGQQTNEPEEPERPDNLWKPVPGNYGAHGRFDAVARQSSFQFWLGQHKEAVFGAIALAAAAAAWHRRASAQSRASRTSELRTSERMMHGIRTTTTPMKPGAAEQPADAAHNSVGEPL
ncbi:MAG: hypothetical protein LC791_18930 [Acidobacteria bacterium]|nr:hypothetical protein [Acidobacteriota bacterium]